MLLLCDQAPLDLHFDQLSQLYLTQQRQNIADECWKDVAAIDVIIQSRLAAKLEKHSTSRKGIETELRAEVQTARS